MSEFDDHAFSPGEDEPAASPFDPPYVVQHDWERTQLTVAVVSAVGDVTNTDPVDLPPLFDAVDPDGLEQLLEPRPDGTRQDVAVTFPFADCLVRVTGAGEIHVRPPDAPAADD